MKDILIHDRRTFAEGKTIIHQGDIPTAAYLIQEGSVEILRETENGEESLAILGKEEIIGEMALINKKERNAFVRALEPTVVYVITKETLEKKIENSDPLVQKLLIALVKRLDRMDEQLVKVIDKNARNSPSEPS